MTTGETSISLNDNIQRVIDVGRMSGVRDLSRRSSNSREEASNHSFLSESSRIDQLLFHESRWRQQRPRRRRRRRWKFSICFRCTPAVRDEDIPCSRDAPPTYSSIFADHLSHEFTFQANDRSFVVARIPPPTYNQAQGVDLVEPSMDPFMSASPNATSDWPRAPAAAICRQCSTLIITVVVVRRSTITHLTALTLCLLGCWPCCMIPYCMDSLNNTDHYCPICHAYLGTNTS